MLTKTDLKSIEKVIDNRLDVKLDGKLSPINKRLRNIEKVTTQTQKDVKKLQKDLAKTSNFLDKENLKAVERVRVIEEHLGFPEPAII